MNEIKRMKKDQKIQAKQILDGYIPSPKDKRDYKEKDVCTGEIELPKTYKSEYKVAVINQGAIGSCVAHAIATTMGYCEEHAKNKHNDYSRGFIYANRRITDYQGEGLVAREALKNVHHCGDCIWDIFPWNEKYPDVKKRLEKQKEHYMNEASPYGIQNYYRCTTEEEVKRAIIRNGAVLVCMPLYDGFGTNVRVPKKGEKSTGSHAMCCIGWNENGWIIQNSWSKFWGDKGLCYVPYKYPVREWWAITVKDNPINENKTIKNFFFKLGRSIKFAFVTIFQYIAKLFEKKDKAED